VWPAAESDPGDRSLGAGTLLGLVALGVTVLALQSSRPAGLLRASGGLLVVALAAMLVTRDNVRRAALVAAGFEHTPWVAPQWAAAGLFLVTLVAAVGTVGWMAAQLLSGRAADGP
jgi:hypothetical protein